MLDVSKELRKYRSVDLEEKVCLGTETSQLISIFNKNLERIGKDQYKSNRNTDEILEILDEDKSKNELITSFREKFEMARDDRDMLLKGIIDMIELFEDLYIYSEKSLNQSFSEQIGYQWTNLEQMVLSCGISLVGKQGEIFDSKLHIAREVKKDPLLPNMLIIEVIRRGFIYKGVIIRKSEVVVNNL